MSIFGDSTRSGGASDTDMQIRRSRFEPTVITVRFVLASLLLLVFFFFNEEAVPLSLNKNNLYGEWKFQGKNHCVCYRQIYRQTSLTPCFSANLTRMFYMLRSLL